MGDEKLADSSCPESGGEMEARMAENAMGYVVERDLKIVGGEWRTTANDRSWRLVRENSESEIEEGKEKTKTRPWPTSPLTTGTRGGQQQ